MGSGKKYIWVDLRKCGGFHIENKVDPRLYVIVDST